MAVDVVHVVLHLLDRMWRNRRALLEDLREVAREVIYACAPIARLLDEREAAFANAIVRFAARNDPLLRGFDRDGGGGAEAALEHLNRLIDQATTMEEVHAVARAIRLFAYILLVAYRLYIGEELRLLKEAKELPGVLEPF